MSARDDFYVHTVTARPVTGHTAYGTTYGDPVQVVCFVDEQTRLVRDADGAEVVSTATIYTHPGTVLPVGTEVTLPSGRDAHVLTVAARTVGDPDVDHVEILVG